MDRNGVSQFEEWYEEQRRLATKLLGGDVAAAEDACQEARKDVYRHTLHSNVPIGAFWPYLRRATVRACYRELRRRRRDHLRWSNAASQYFIAEAPAPEIAVMLADTLLTSDRIVRERLGSPYIEIFRLCFYDGLTPPQIAYRLGLSLSAVKQYKRRTIALLRAMLDAS